MVPQSVVMVQMAGAMVMAVRSPSTVIARGIGMIRRIVDAVDGGIRRHGIRAVLVGIERVADKGPIPSFALLFVLGMVR